MPQKIERSGMSLFNGNEEVVEASHQKFEIFWSRYKIKQLDSDTHVKNILNCVIDLTSRLPQLNQRAPSYSAAKYNHHIFSVFLPKMYCPKIFFAKYSVHILAKYFLHSPHSEAK